MIGATDQKDALREAARSVSGASVYRKNLQIYDHRLCRYKPVQKRAR